MNSHPTYYKCPGCDMMHAAQYNHSGHASPTPRLTRMQLDVLHGHGGWNEIRHSEVAAWRAGVTHQQEREST